jgi:hypothetical protein
MERRGFIVGLWWHALVVAVLAAFRAREEARISSRSVLKENCHEST